MLGFSNRFTYTCVCEYVSVSCCISVCNFKCLFISLSICICKFCTASLEKCVHLRYPYKRLYIYMKAGMRLFSNISDHIGVFISVFNFIILFRVVHDVFHVYIYIYILILKRHFIMLSIRYESIKYNF